MYLILITTVKSIYLNIYLCIEENNEVIISKNILPMKTETCNYFILGLYFDINVMEYYCKSFILVVVSRNQIINNSNMTLFSWSQNIFSTAVACNYRNRFLIKTLTCTYYKFLYGRKQHTLHYYIITNFIIFNKSICNTYWLFKLIFLQNSLMFLNKYLVLYNFLNSDHVCFYLYISYLIILINYRLNKRKYFYGYCWFVSEYAFNEMMNIHFILFDFDPGLSMVASFAPSSADSNYMII